MRGWLSEPEVTPKHLQAGAVPGLGKANMSIREWHNVLNLVSCECMFPGNLCFVSKICAFYYYYYYYLQEQQQHIAFQQEPFTICTMQKYTIKCKRLWWECIHFYRA